MTVFREMSPVLLHRVLDARAACDAKEGIIAGNEVPFAEVVLRVELHPGSRVHRHQDFLSHYPRIEHFAAFVLRQRRIAPRGVNNGNLPLGRVDGRCGHLPRRNTLQDAVIGTVNESNALSLCAGKVNLLHRPTRREAVDDVPEVLDDARRAKAFNHRVSVAPALERLVEVRAQLAVVKQQAMAHRLTDIQGINRTIRPLRDPAVRIGFVRTLFSEFDRRAVQHFLGKLGSRNVTALQGSHVRRRWRGLGSEVASSERKARVCRRFAGVLPVHIADPVDDRLAIAFFKGLEIPLPERFGVPIHHEVVLADERTHQAEVLGFVLRFDLPHVRLIVGQVTSAVGISIGINRRDSIPSFLISCRLRPTDCELRTDVPGTLGVIIPWNEVKPRIFPACADE
jgi:hypothetical protein